MNMNISQRGTCTKPVLYQILVRNEMTQFQSPSRLTLSLIWFNTTICTTVISTSQPACVTAVSAITPHIYHVSIPRHRIAWHCTYGRHIYIYRLRLRMRIEMVTRQVAEREYNILSSSKFKGPPLYKIGSSQWSYEPPDEDRRKRWPGKGRMCLQHDIFIQRVVCVWRWCGSTSAGAATAIK